MTSPIDHVLQFFKYDHLPAELQVISKQYCELAQIVATRSTNPETTVALRKLLESKDAAVRAELDQRVLGKVESHSDPLTALEGVIRQEGSYSHWREASSGADAFKQIVKWIERARKGEL
jgi:lipopolysaccharide biosynthesis regulator YciM